MEFVDPFNKTNDEIISVVFTVTIVDQNFTSGSDANLVMWTIDKGTYTANVFRTSYMSETNKKNSDLKLLEALSDYNSAKSKNLKDISSYWATIYEDNYFTLSSNQVNGFSHVSINEHTVF